MRFYYETKDPDWPEVQRERFDPNNQKFVECADYKEAMILLEVMVGDRLELIYTKKPDGRVDEQLYNVGDD